MVKRRIQIQGARHMEQLNTPTVDKGGNFLQQQLNTVLHHKHFSSPTNIFPGMKNVSTFGRNEYVGKQGTADSDRRFKNCAHALSRKVTCIREMATLAVHPFRTPATGSGGPSRSLNLMCGASQFNRSVRWPKQRRMLYPSCNAPGLICRHPTRP